MSHFQFSELADRDLDVAFDDLRHKSPRAAEHFLDSLERKCDLYADSPLLGIPRDDLAEHLRCFPVKPFLVFYRPLAISGGIEIARVLHGRRNITPDLFDS